MAKFHLWSVGLMLVVGLAVLQVGGTARRSEMDSIARLAEVAGTDRPVDLRLVGGFKFAPLRGQLRGAASAANLSLLAAAGELQIAAATDPTGPHVHAWGLAQLLLGDSDAAVSTLENLSLDHLTPALLANLGAAYGARAASAADPSDWFRALTYSERALLTAPVSAEALFNRALALEALRLREEAIAAWQIYLEEDRRSEWSAEAREHLDELLAIPEMVEDAPPPSLATDLIDAALRGADERLDRLIAADPENARKMVDTQFLQWWADGTVAAPALVRIAERFTAVTTDRLTSDLYHSLAQRGRARSAVENFLKIAAASDQSRFDEVRRHIEAAVFAVRDIRPLSLWLRYYSLQAEAERGVPDGLADRLAALETEAALEGYLYLRATVANRLGQILGRLGSQQQAIAARSRAIMAFTAGKSLDQAASMEVLIAESFRYLGDLDRAFQHHQRSLQLSAQFRTFRTRHQVLVQAGLTATAAGLHEAAVRFYSEARRNASRWVSLPAAAAVTAVRLSSALQASGAADSARVLADEAARLLDLVPDPGFRQRTELELLELRAGLLPPSEAVAEVDRGIVRFRASGFAVRLPRLYLLKARRLQELEQFAPALAAVESGLGYVHSARRAVTDPALRRSQTEMFVELQTEAARIHLRNGDSWQALARVDAVKALSLEERFPLAQTSSVSNGEPTSIQALLAPSSAVLVLADVGGQTDGWYISATTFRHLPSLLPTAHLRTAVRRFRGAITSANTERARELGAFLGRRLLEPLGDELGQLSRLVIVPSADAAGLPFAALRINGDQRYLVEAVTLSLSPSLELLRRTASRAVRTGPSRRILVAVSEGDRDALPRLPHARDEAATVAALYPMSTVVDGGPADAFSRSYRDADVFHFVGHAVLAIGRGPTLVLGPDARTDLTADRISELGAGRLQTVVLAACSSVFRDGDSRTVDALLSTAAPFLAAGVPEVVGTLWDIQDDDAARLSYALHVELSGGSDASLAVANVQRRAVASARPPADWASVQVFSTPTPLNQPGVYP